MSDGSDLDLAIGGGTVVTASDTYRADVGIRDGRTVLITEDIRGAPASIDADGLLILPGGVDAHCHLAQPPKGNVEYADDFESGTLSALAGGTTTVMPFVLQLPDMTLREAVDDYQGKANGKAAIVYAFHLILTKTSPQVLGQELPALIRDGYNSFKIFMTYDDFRLDDRQILEIFAVAGREGGLVMVHAENHHCIQWMSHELVSAGKTSPKYHETSRPMAVEREATHRAISLAEVAGVPVFLVHVSAREAAEQIAWAQNRGLLVYGETCSQYLCLSEQDLDRPGFEGAKFICSAALWRALQLGTLQIVSSDHSPTRFDDPKGKKFSGIDAPFTKVPNGIPGLETRLPLVWSDGVATGRITANQFVGLTATAPAAMYGLARKGRVTIGADADLVLWDPTRRTTLRNEDMHHNMDYTPYEGFEVTGWPVITLSRGEVVWKDGEITAEPGRGQFIVYDTPGPVTRAGL